MHPFKISPRRLWLGTAAAASGILLLSACANGSTSNTSAAPLAVSAAAGSTTCAGLMSSSLATAAKKEGTLVLTNSATPAFSNNVLPVFEKESGLKVQVVSGRSSELVAKLTAERRSKIYSYDVFLGGGSTLATVFYPNKWLAPLKPLLMAKETLDPTKYVGGKLPFKDPDGEYIFANSTYQTGQIAYNTKLVQPSDVQSWQQLVDPRWQGKIVIDDPTGAGSGDHVAAGLRTTFGDDFFKKLYVDQKPAVLTDYTAELNGVADGQYAISIAPRSELIESLQAKGLPIAAVAPSGIRMSSNGASIMAVYANAPHPNVAALFANWLACPQGNGLFNKAYDYVSSRSDVPDTAPDYMRIDPSQTYFDSGSWDQLVQSAAIDKENAKLIGK